MRLEGRIWQRAGRSVPVVCFHKTMEDVFRLLSQAGFSRVLEFRELYVTDECWPEFRRPQLLRAIEAFAGRKRKFGGLLRGDGAAAGQHQIATEATGT